MTNKTKRTIAVSTVLTLATATIFTLTSVKGLFQLQARELTDFDVDLVINSSNITSGSGSVTLNGNTFDYEGFVVSGDTITLSSGSTLSYSGESGSSFADDNFVGGGFTKLEFSLLAESTFNMSVNDNAEVFENRSGAVSITINSPFLDAEVTSGSFSVTALHVKYSCVAPSVTQALAAVGAGDFVSAGKLEYYTNLMGGLHNTADVHVPSITTYTMAVIADASKQGGERFRNALNELTSFDAIVVQVTRRSTRTSYENDGNNSVEKAETDALLSMASLLRSKTSRIIIMAPYGGNGQKIFTNDGSVTYKDSKSVESYTRSEASEYYSECARRMATAIGGEVMDFARAYELFVSAYGSTPSTAIEYYLMSCCYYSTLYNRAVPSACEFDNDLDANTAALARLCAERACVTK